MKIHKLVEAKSVSPDSLNHLIRNIVLWENAKRALAKLADAPLPTDMVGVAVLLKRMGVDVDSWPQGWLSNPVDCVRETLIFAICKHLKLDTTGRKKRNPCEQQSF